MKKKLFISAFVVISTVFLAKTQTTIYFQYDDCGNRKSRSITMPSLKSTEENNALPKEYSDNLDGKEVLIYPNPVKSEITIEIPELGDDEFGSLKIYNQEGKLALQKNKVSRKTMLNLSELPHGIYYLNISLADKTIQWKIIKE
ncbi:MAG: T9SS type A sorting domain-containing protein [Bacteroidales bacterium]|nr:T9SS type A sorting domain-containing protein [Bacteroidales bacterium]